MADRLLDLKLARIAETGAAVVAAGNPGCLMQIAKGARAAGRRARGRAPGDAAGPGGRGGEAVKIRLREHARFSPEKMAKITLGATARVHLDLYALEPGQAQKVHTHDDQDKVYVVLDGRGRFTVGAVEETLEAGEAIVAAAGAPHGVANDSGARLLLLVLVSPPPPHA